MTIFLPALAGLLIAGFIGLILALRPSSQVYDRILALNFIGTLTVLFIAVVGFVFGRPAFLDIAAVYALINFIGTVAVLKYLQANDVGSQATDKSAQANSSNAASEAQPK